MPVMDTDQPNSSSINTMELEEQERLQMLEKLRQEGRYVQQPQNAEMPQPSEAQKPDSLLPILNTIYQQHETRIEALQDKVATREAKIAKNEAKIDKLSAKVQRLQDTNAMLQGLSGGVLSQAVTALMERNRRKIEKIQNVSIPRRETKIEKHQTRIALLQRKIEVSQAKADKMQCLSLAIKSFAIRNPEERRQQYAQSMDGLHDASKRVLSFQMEKCESRIARQMERYERTESTADRLSVGNRIQNLQNRREALSARMEKLSGMTVPFAEQTPERVNALMAHTEETIRKAAQENSTPPAQLAEQVVADAEDYLRVTELSMEQNYDSIDGVLNNLPPEPETETQEEQQKQAVQMQQAEVEEERKKQEEQKREQEQHQPKEKSEKNWLLAMEAVGLAEIHADGSFLANPELYKEIPLEALMMQTYPEKQAMPILENLAALGAKFSAAFEPNSGNVTIAMDKRDSAALEQFAALAKEKIEERAEKAPEQTVQKQQTKTKPAATKIHAEYYAALPKEERFTVVVPSKETAQKVMDALEQKSVPFSAVVRDPAVTALTVAKENAPALQNVQDAVRKETVREFIHPEVYQKLAKEDRYTQRMTESEAKEAVRELEKEGVEHSAVLAGEKSAVTVHKKDKGAVFFSRKQMKQQQQKQQQRETQKPPKEKSRDSRGKDAI